MSIQRYLEKERNKEKKKQKKRPKKHASVDGSSILYEIVKGIRKF